MTAKNSKFSLPTVKSFITESRKKKVDEAQMDKTRIAFGSFGGSMDTSISTDMDDERIFVLGLNSSSYGHKEYYKQFDAEPTRVEQDKERKAVLDELKKLADKFDNDVIAALKKLGYE